MKDKQNENSIQSVTSSTRWRLVFYDVLLYIAVALVFLILHPSQNERLEPVQIVVHALMGCACIIGCRFAFSIYRQIWRYGGMTAYILMSVADLTGLCIYYVLEDLLPSVQYARALLVLSIVCVDLLCAMGSRMVYYVLYQNAGRSGKFGRIARFLIRFLGGIKIEEEEISAAKTEGNKIRVAIVGAGRLGLSLAADLKANPNSMYTPVCFIDADSNKVGRSLEGLPVLSEKHATPSVINNMNIQEIILAITNLDAAKKQDLYTYYRTTGCRVRVYDYPVTKSAKASKLQIREFDIEELLPRRVINLDNPETDAGYTNKVVMVTGGGGSIGSELCRQIAKASPKQLIIVDFAENTTYDLQQELRMAYKDRLNFCVEIANVCDKSAMSAIFEYYKPEIVLHAAAHKHVPLMEHNCSEAVKNNIFGTANIVDRCIANDVKRFTLISSDKAVNPTNVMGATKRMCEMIVQCAAKSQNDTVFSAVRFGNVMGSAGSVIPLFKKQIANGGPVTITDKRIIRYFMTISEASHLVLTAGTMAKSGELFVLDMGEPCKILELAENMIRLSGYTPYKDIDIIETGLRPGEKLYEELLMKSETLEKTDNDLIFIEHDEALPTDELIFRIKELGAATATEDNDRVRRTLKECVPTFRSPEEVNANAENSAEMIASNMGK